MATTTTPTAPKTLLEALNDLLRAIRIAPVMSLLATDLNADAAAAKQALDTASVELQTRGWEFNREREVIIDPGEDGSVVLPLNTLKVHSSRFRDSGRRLVQRGDRLYNPKLRTFNIGEPATVDIVLALEFQDLPQAARMYVTALAARRFCLPRLPTGAAFNYTEEMLSTAMSTMEQEDADVEDSTLPETSPHFADMARR